MTWPDTLLQLARRLDHLARGWLMRAELERLTDRLADVLVGFDLLEQALLEQPFWPAERLDLSEADQLDASQAEIDVLTAPPEDVGGFMADNQPSGIIQLMRDGQPVGVPVTVRTGDEVEVIDWQLHVTSAAQAQARALEGADSHRVVHAHLMGELRSLKAQLEDLAARIGA